MSRNRLNFETQTIRPEKIKAGDRIHSERLGCTVEVVQVEEIGDENAATVISVEPVGYRNLKIPLRANLPIDIAREANPPASWSERVMGEIWEEHNRFWGITSRGTIVGPCMSRLQAENELDDWEEGDS